MLTPTYLNTNQSEECPQADHALFKPLLENSSLPPAGWDIFSSFEGISLLWPPLPGKAIKLFFSTSPQTPSLRFNSMSGNRGRIQLHSLSMLLPSNPMTAGFIQLLVTKGYWFPKPFFMLLYTSLSLGFLPSRLGNRKKEHQPKKRSAF